MYGRCFYQKCGWLATKTFIIEHENINLVLAMVLGNAQSNSDEAPHYSPVEKMPFEDYITFWFWR